MFDTHHILVGFVPLACDQHHIARVCMTHHLGDCIRTQDFCTNIRRACIHARQNILNNGFRIFGARIVRSHHNGIGDFLCNRTHLRPFARVAIATTTKHTDQLPTALLRNWAQCQQGFFQSIGGVRKIHHHKGRILATKTLHPPWSGCDVRAIDHTLRHIQTQSHTHAEYAEQIHHIERTHQLRCHRILKPINIQGECRQCASLVNLAGV